jgi:hypothetical protein
MVVRTGVPAFGVVALKILIFVVTAVRSSSSVEMVTLVHSSSWSYSKGHTKQLHTLMLVKLHVEQWIFFLSVVLRLASSISLL